MTTDRATVNPAPAGRVAPLDGIGGAPLPQVATYDDHDNQHDVIDLLFLERFISGEEPWGRFVALSRVREDATLVPAGGTVVRTIVDKWRTTQLVVGEGWTLRIGRDRQRNGYLTVSAVDEATGQAVLDDASTGAEEEPEPEADAAVIGFWHHGSHGPVRHARTIAATPWPQLRSNYNRRAGAALTRLMSTTSEGIDGRLVLLHGPPGTGKTTALRSLALAWRRWCQVDVQQDQIRSTRGKHFQRLRNGGRLPDHFYVWFPLQHADDAFPKHGVVVHQQQLYRLYGYIFHAHAPPTTCNSTAKQAPARCRSNRSSPP